MMTTRCVLSCLFVYVLLCLCMCLCVWLEASKNDSVVRRLHSNCDRPLSISPSAWSIARKKRSLWTHSEEEKVIIIVTRVTPQQHSNSQLSCIYDCLCRWQTQHASRNHDTICVWYDTSSLSNSVQLLAQYVGFHQTSSPCNGRYPTFQVSSPDSWKWYDINYIFLSNHL